MKSSIAEILPIIGTTMDGGFYAGRIRIADQVFALIVAPKIEGETEAVWHDEEKRIDGVQSFNDGAANTQAMAEAGSDLAKWARDLRIAGHADWYLPSQDELEVMYRNLKPTTRENYCWARAGINLSAVEPTRPYTPDFPKQTLAEAFQAGGEQAFTKKWYWSSTQHASYADYAWCQTFNYGDQVSSDVNNELRARAVRRLTI